MKVSLVVGAILSVGALVLQVRYWRASRRSKPGKDPALDVAVKRARHLDWQQQADSERPRRTIEASGITLDALVMKDQRFPKRHVEDVLANRVVPDFARDHRRGPRSILVVAVHDDITVGTAVGLILEHPRQQPVLFAMGVYVDVVVKPPIEGGGLESQLFSKLISSALANGCTKVWLAEEVASLGQHLSPELTT